MNKPTFSTELQALQSMDISELMALLTTQEDRLSRNVVDECIRRGENIVPKLRALLENETYWSEEVSAGQWWALLHAIMILGAIPGQATAEALLLGFQRIQNHQDEALWDWFAGYWPALFRNKREYVRTQLEKIAADEKLDWYPRIQALDCLIEAAHARGPAHLEDCLDWIQALIRTSWSDHYFCGLAGNILLDFPRQRHREMLESLGDRLQQKISIAPPFTRKDVDSALSRGKDQPEWERFANPWQFYDEQAIRDRQERWAREAAEKQAAEEKARQPLVREAPKVGRNDPCPCGSGKKYKKCCLTKAQEKPADLTWRRLRRAIEGLPPRILAFATEHCGRAALEEAWEAFVLFEDDSFHPEHPLITVFMPWFFYHWQPLWGETGIAPGSLQPGQTIAAAFLDSRQGSRLPPLARRYLEQAIAMPFSFFDILANRPGQGFEMRDIFTGETLQITEHSASQTLRPHDIILAMPVCLDGLAAVLESCASIAIPPAHKGEVLGLRKLLQGAADPVSRETLLEFDLEILETYQQLHALLTDPRPPQIQNTDGEPLRPQDLIFDIDSPQDAFDALWPLSMADDQTGLLDKAETDDEGRQEKITFPWLKKGNARHQSWDNTILGQIHIDDRRLTINVNSDGRAARIKTEVEKRLGKQARYRSTVHHSVEKALTEASADQRRTPEAEDSAEWPPELREKIIEMMEQEWDQWIHETIPALNDMTPLDAVKDPDGQEMVEALLAGLQRRTINPQLPDYDPVPGLRRRLGLNPNEA